MKRKSQNLNPESGEWDKYDWEGNPKPPAPPAPPADRIERQPGISLSDILTIAIVSIVIGLILAIIMA